MHTTVGYRAFKLVYFIHIVGTTSITGRKIIFVYRLAAVYGSSCIDGLSNKKRVGLFFS